MIPSVNTVLNAELSIASQSSKQHWMDLNKNKITRTCDGLEAIKQTVFKILNTERYDYLIYSWNYGIELVDLYGQAPILVFPEVERRVTEALLQDDRITAVDTFEFEETKKGVVFVTFTVHTIYGEIYEEMAVNI